MEQINTLPTVEQEVFRGLESDPKWIPTKYFYDQKGSEIFRDIMRMPSYYLTNAELEIFHSSKSEITDLFCDPGERIDLVELGAGDGTKTRILISELVERKVRFRYVPIDISEESNRCLERDMREHFPEIEIEPMTGDYFERTAYLTRNSKQRKVLLFLGSNLGNYSLKESSDFLSELHSNISADDKLLIGLDLKKDPRIISSAYDDPHGHTLRFNLNLLERMNRELGADFRTDRFIHTPLYDPSEGIAKSYLVSTEDQDVHFEESGKTIHFNRWEPIFTEMSQKYDMQMINYLAGHAGFTIEKSFFDQKRYFTDTIWRK